MYKYDSNQFMSHLYEGVYIVDAKRKIVFWNSGSEQITGFKDEEVKNSFCYNNILQHIDESGKRLCFEGCPLQETLNTGQIKENNVFLHHKDGHRIPVKVKTMPLYDDLGNIVAAVEVFNDARCTRETYEENTELRKLLDTDNLTNIFNRRYLEFHLSSSESEFSQFATPFGVLFIDIDNFKNINDSYGHKIGDEILKMVSKTITSNIRVEDIFGRWGGEEFIVIFKRIDVTQILKLAEKLRLTVKNSSYQLSSGKSISVTISIGGTIYKPGEHIEDLVERADELMYESKQAGRDKTTIR